MLPTPADLFTEFGPSKYLRHKKPSSLVVSTDYREVRAQLRTDCPRLPGVYGMIDCVGRLIYVGKSRNLRNRTIAYFQKDAKAGQQPTRKEQRIAARANALVWESAGHELLALLREQELIRRFGPEMNIRGRSRRRLVYVFLSVEDAPRFKVATNLPKFCRHHWGPVVRTGGLVRAVELLNRHFKLPDCPPDTAMHFRDQAKLFELDWYPMCLRGQMNSCLATCAAAITRSQYAAELQRASAFLGGRDDTPLDDLDRQIKQAVDLRHFEQAACLHDTRTQLAELRGWLLPRPDLFPSSFVYAFAYGDRTGWLAMHDGLVMKVGPAPRSEHGRRIWHAQLSNWPKWKSPVIDEREGRELSIVTGWFRSNPEELVHVADFDAAQAMCN